MNSDLRRKKEIKANCLGSCIVSHLNSKGNKISEADLYCNKRMLTTYFCTTSNCLETPIEELIVEDIQKTGVKLKKIKEININKLDHFLKDGHMIILNINSRHLRYSDTYTKTPTTLSNHYININYGKDGHYHIYDAYIPTTCNRQVKLNSWRCGCFLGPLIDTYFNID